jgi:hypothetical protein
MMIQVPTYSRNNFISKFIGDWTGVANFQTIIIIREAEYMYIICSKLAGGRRDRSFVRDRINRGPVLQQVWHVIEHLLLQA